MKLLISLRGKLLLTALLALVFIPYLTPSIAHAATFDPTRIIDDGVFYNKSSMSVQQIQDFLNAKVPTCDTNHAGFTGGSGTVYSPPWVCLKDYYENNSSTYTVSYSYQNTSGTVISVTRTFTNNNAYLYTALTPIYNTGGYTQGLKSIAATIQSVGGTRPANSISAAQIIWNAAQTYDINPQVILVTLQKENSLITDTWPAAWQYEQAMGYGCPDTAACDNQYSGFYNQVISAAWQFRAYATNPNGYNYVPGPGNNVYYSPVTSTCPSPTSSTLNIQNQATASLYDYTPYQPNAAALAAGYGTGDGCSAYGNRNFWLYFNAWFGSPINSSPIYKTSIDSRLYFVWNTTKYYIPTSDIIYAWGLQKYSANVVSGTYFSDNGIVDGGSLSNILKMSDDPSSPIYLLDDGKRYPVPLTACATDLNNQPVSNTSWAIDCFNSGIVKSYPGWMVQRYTALDISLPQMIANQNSVWKIEAGKKRRIVDPLVINVLGGWSMVRWMQDINAQQPVGMLLMRNGWVTRFTGSPTVYLYDNNQLNPVATPDDLVAWNLQNSINDYPANYNLATPLPVGATITRIAKDSNDNYYIIDKGYKLAFNGDSAQWPTSTATLASGELPKIPTIPLSNVYLSDASGQIYTVHGSLRYVFPTMDDFFQLGFNTASIRRVSGAIETLPGLGYGGMHMANGRLYKISNNLNQIYMVNNATSLYVNSINYPGLPYSKLIAVDPITATRYPVVGTYTP